jgi:formate hydrogenlyase subunit 3/multisubunit Na+/H+ antiporter MnhD subunit
MNGFLLGTILFALGGLAAMLVSEKTKSFIFIAAATAAQFFILPSAFETLFNNKILEAQLYFSEPVGSAFIRMDALAALFVIIISIGGLLSSIYSSGYMKMYRGRTQALSSYYFFLGLMIASMLLVVTVQNALLFLIVWEVMSLSSFFLVMFESEKPEVRKAGIYYLTAMQIGSAFLIAAFSWTSAISGSLDFNSFGKVLANQNSVSILLFILFFIGFGTKAGFVPMHTWLPRAHPAAPTGVSAIMSGVMIKTGIYGILRIILLSGKPNEVIAYVVFAVGLFTGIIGIANAISQKDLKKLLAYSSIENMGIVGIGIGLGMLGLVYNINIIAVLGFTGALLHVVNHFIFKSVLFYGAGVVYTHTHTRNIDKLGGLVKVLPSTSVMFLIASLAISGMPVLNGFISEFAIYLGMAKSFSADNLAINIAAIIGLSGLAFIGVMALLCFTKVYGICFLGMPREPHHYDVNEKTPSFFLPSSFLTVLIFIIGLSPLYAVYLIGNILKQFLPGDSFSTFYSVLPVFETITNVFIVFIGLVFLVWIMRSMLLSGKKVKEFKTWDCGYQVQSSRIQYTSSSFAQPFMHLVKELVPQKIKLSKEEVIFPKKARLESTTQDFLERILIQPSLNFLNKFMNLFSWIQSGRMQQYIIYGLLFLIILLIWIVGIA